MLKERVVAQEAEELVPELYKTYCEAVGGKAFNGDPLPIWEEFSKDEKKKRQADAWREVAKKVVRLIEDEVYYQNL